MDNGIYSASTFHPDQLADPPSSRNIQDNSSVSSVPSTSNSEAANLPQNYSYAGYPSSDSYGYGNTGYAGYYGGYQQQQSNQSYPQPVGAYQSTGAYQNTGAPHQPISSFQNSVPYAGPTNYSSTYYNPGDYQTSGGYQSCGYNNQNQTNLWQQGNYANYANQYPNYMPESNGAYSSSNAAATSLQYQQHFKQWADYYSQTEVSCAPGTENVSATSTVNVGCPVPGGYSCTNSQQPAPFTTSWKPEATYDLPSVQPSAVISSLHDGYWKQGTPGFQNHTVNPIQSNLRMPLDSNPTYGSFQEQHKPEYPQGANVHYPANHQVTQNYHTSLQPVQQTISQTVSQTVQQPVSQTVMPLDSRVSKMQIPTNPRIATNLALGLPKTDKENSVNSATAKPVYISVAPPKTNDKMSYHNAADSILKPGMFPKSLCGYVERALSRCKDDTQMAACQAVMKEVITKATADGTLDTRDWDTEPLFPLPNTDAINNEVLQSSTPVSSLARNRKSPSRRSKSRWEPLSVEKSIDKQSTFTPEVKYGGWFNLREEKFLTGKLDKENNRGNLKFPSPDQKATNKNSQRPAKRQRLGDDPSGTDGDASSDSDAEQNLTAYYSGAIALSDTPEERKRRESRSKRFEKARGNRVASNHFRLKNAGARLYTRRDTALVLRKNFEDGNSRPVEDIDRDSLTVKGTCQEIEKGYLRLTSAPDPATVRPEEVLEKALLMVQNSQKNYFYKCDQLKSIRQDLTVQHIRNELTVKVYETHARLAIEVGDLSEYNQCQSQLKVLYAEGNKGCDMEFSAYNLLCVILHSNNNRDLLSALSRLSVEARKDEAVKHALEVRAAVTSGNYVLFFRLYKAAPNLNTCLMDLYVEKMRYTAVKCMSRSYRPTLAVSYIAQVLGFSGVLPTVEPSDEKDSDGLEECVEWLKAHGACLTTENSGEILLDSKSSTSSLFMPEPEDAVAHGDATLAVNDFLTRTPS